MFLWKRCSIRRISYHNIKSFLVSFPTKYVAEPGVPKEDLVVAGEVEGAEFAEYVVVEVLDAQLLVDGVAYLVAQFFLLAVVATGIVLRE